MIPIDPGNLRDFIIACVLLARLWGGIRFVDSSFRAPLARRVVAKQASRPAAKPKRPPLTAGKISIID